MKIDSIYMLSRSSYANRLPGIWILQGSNDGNIYTDIQQFNTTSIAQSNGNFTVHLDKYYDSYYYYRIYVSSAAGGDCINIATITVYGYFTT